MSHPTRQALRLQKISRSGRSHHFEGAVIGGDAKFIEQRLEGPIRLHRRQRIRHRLGQYARTETEIDRRAVKPGNRAGEFTAIIIFLARTIDGNRGIKLPGAQRLERYSEIIKGADRQRPQPLAGQVI